ncbi:MAG: RNA polymerase sigma factor [Oscillospiraceae bacterium]|nr:RNA polymerase sigma factor [Oscillospiraceae bacterium]
MTDDILKLVVYSKGGNKESYGRLYEFYSNDMYRFALSICKNRSDAEDAVQEAALSVFKSIHCLYDPTKFKTYLFTALSNACKKTFREKTDELPENLAYEIEDFISADVKNALDLLDTASREIVLLSAVGGFKSGEIAKILDMPSVTVRTKKRRALSKMRKELE